MAKWRLPTVGGLQCWTDHRIRDGYRVQQNMVTGQWRTLDPHNARLAAGDREQCLTAIDDARPWQNRDDDGRCVTVLLHGLIRNRRCMIPMANAIRSGGGHPIDFGYASSRATLSDHASALQAVIEDWPSSWRLRFVAHSMGNIVVRHWIADLNQFTRPAADHLPPSAPVGILDRCQAMVMLGPPNQGSSIARKLDKTGLFGIFAGRGGRQLGPNFDDTIHRLAIPPFPFVVIAGDITHHRIRNPMLDGPNDLLVTVDETRLDGMVQQIVVPVLHARLMANTETIQLTAQWLDRLAESVQ